jgi:probable F420-dependent oxidoreductase
VEIALNLPVAHPGLTPALLRDLARLAEELGFVELYLGEHVVLFDRPADAYPSSDDGEAFFDATAPLPDPLVTHAFVAAATSRIRLATGVMLLPQRNPVYTAKHLASLDWLSGGRLDVGIGVGWSREEYAACGVPWEARGARCDEWIEVMRSLWTEPVSRYSGRFYELAPCRQYPKPVQRPHPPLWIGGWSPAALERTARLGDGWYGFDLPPEQVAACVREIERRCEAHGRSFAALTLACGAWSRMPRERADLAPYAAAGVQHFALSLASSDPAAMPDELRRLARTFIAKR